MGALVVLGLIVVAAAPPEAPAQARHGEARKAPDPGKQGGNQIGNAFEHVHALAVDGEGQALYLGTHAGLYRSQDRGKTWKRVPVGARDRHLDVMAIVADPRDARTLSVATHEAGVFRTPDGGASWVAISAGLGGVDVHGLALDPSEPKKLHAAVRGQGEGIYRTTDAGGKWVRVDDGPPGEVKVLASVNIPTGMGGIWLYAGTAEGLVRSADCF